MLDIIFNDVSDLDEMKAAYDKYGVLLVKNLIGDSTINNMRKITADLVNSNHNFLESYLEVSTNKKILRRIKQPTEIDPIFKKVLLDKKVINILRKLLGDNIRLDGTKLNIKPAFHGESVEWHQDWAYLPHTNDDLLTIGVFIDDCVKDNAPLLVIPGTHKTEILEHHHDGYFYGLINPNNKKINFANAIPLLGKKGTISIHHYRCVHGSDFNRSSNSRRILYGRFGASDAWPLNGISDFFGGFSFSELQQRIVLGEQTIKPRLASVPIIMPQPLPGDETVFETQKHAPDKYFK